MPTIHMIDESKPRHSVIGDCWALCGRYDPPFLTRLERDVNCKQCKKKMSTQCYREKIDKEHS